MVIRRVFDAVNRRDLDTVLAEFDPEAWWQPAVEDPDASLHRGHAGVEGFVRGWLEIFDKLEVQLEEMVEGERATLALNHYVGRGIRSGVQVDDRVFQLFSFRDGRIVSVQEFYDRDEALLALRASNEPGEAG